MAPFRDALLNLLLVLSAILAGFTGLGGVERIQAPRQIEARAQVEVATAALAAVAEAVSLSRAGQADALTIPVAGAAPPAAKTIALPDGRARILGERRAE